METSIDAPSIQTPVDTQADAIATQAKASAGTQAKVLVNVNGGKNFLVWNHFENGKVEKDVTKAICNYCQKSYHIDSKSYETSNLLAHVSQHVSTVSSKPTFLMGECIIDPFRSSPPCVCTKLASSHNPNFSSPING